MPIKETIISGNRYCDINTFASVISISKKSYSASNDLCGLNSRNKHHRSDGPRILPVHHGQVHVHAAPSSPSAIRQPLSQTLTPERICRRSSGPQWYLSLRVTLNASETVKPLGRSSTLGNQVSTLGLKKFLVFRVRGTGAIELL